MSWRGSELAPLPMPEEMVQWWLAHISEQLGDDDVGRCLESLVPLVQRLSDNFVAEEGSRALDRYGSQRDMLLAYGAFFFPQTFARVQFPLAELCLARGWRPGALSERRPLRLLDWGAGLGAASLGAIHWLRHGMHREMPDAMMSSVTSTPDTTHDNPSGLNDNSVMSIEADVVELASESLKRYQGLAEALAWSDCTWRWLQGDLRRPEGFASLQDRSWDLILASFSLNEAFEPSGDNGSDVSSFVHWMQWQLQHLAPDGLLLVLEPASEVSCRRLVQARDQLVATGEARVWAPCLHQQACPMGGVEGSWCHEVRHWSVPDHLQWLNRHMHRALSHLKFGFLALGCHEPAITTPGSFGDKEAEQVQAALTMRLVAPMTHKKGRWLTTGCAANGELWPLEIQQRQLSASTKALFKQSERGDLMALYGKAEAIEALSPHPHTGLIRVARDMALASYPGDGFPQGS